ncbi:hypothetical protein J0H58_19835 [bacterium]|nr:hypothetical protein [bacterium]
MKAPVPVPDGYTYQPFTKHDIQSIKTEKGKYLTPNIVGIGDMVITYFAVCKVTNIYQMNYLPRFVVRDMSGKKHTIGKTKIRGKLIKS